MDWTLDSDFSQPELYNLAAADASALDVPAMPDTHSLSLHAHRPGPVGLPSAQDDGRRARHEAREAQAEAEGGHGVVRQWTRWVSSGPYV